MSGYKAVAAQKRTGRARVTIDGGAAYTRSRRVHLDLSWRSNVHGGMALTSKAAKPRATVPLRPTATFVLSGSGRDGKKSSVYAAFQTWDGYETAVDSIVLDLVKPRITTAHVRAGKLRLRAGDEVSGLAQLQLARDRSHPSKPKRFRSVSSRPLGATWVRVIDRAGNASAWTRIGRS